MKLVESNLVRVGAVPETLPPPTSNPLLLNPEIHEEEGSERNKSKKHLVTEFGQTKGRRIYEQADRMQVLT